MRKQRKKNGTFAKGNSVRSGIPHSPETIEKMKVSNRHTGGSFWKGKKLPKSVREKLRLVKLGSKHWNWKGGITPKSAKLRNRSKLREWRKKVLDRDKGRCVWCTKKKRKMCADHIKSFKKYPKLRYVVSNGRTLCYQCHYKTDTFGGRIIK